MASSSSSSVPTQKFDVFLSFRGEDTRDGFTSHLHAALWRSKIVTYIDYELVKGGEISPALLKAIGESNISVIVLSENYASSTWCLDELVHILSCRERNGQIVVPVFYGVAPSVVRKQQGSYATALDVLEQRFAPNTEKVRKWRVALETVAKLSGWDTSVIRPESKLIEEIVKVILERLSRTTRVKDEYKRLVGMQKRVEKIESVLHISSSDIRVICIWGMAGIGKTTLARFVFDQLSSQFDGCCFVEEIAKYLNTLGEKGLKKEVISKLLDDNTISNLSEFAELSFYEDRLQRSKVLIVLDNLKDWNHLRLIVGDDNRFGPGSLIIVTTKDKQVVKNRIDDNRIYEVEGLDHDEALHLFNFNAFSKNLPTANFIEMAKEVVNHCEGNPLALNVLGSYFGSKSEERWKDALEKLKHLPNNEVQKKLKMSYDELDEMQKDIFLDIACFFEGEDKDHVEKILDACGFFAAIGIDDLIDKSLLTVANNKLKMHSLLQEMGQEVVRQQSIKFPEKRSRIWLAKDVHHVLQDTMGNQTIEGIFFNMSEINSEIFLNCTTLQKMKNLRLLKFYNLDPNMKCKVYLPEDFCLPNSLRYLHWDGYSLEAFPTDFTAKYLIELNMPNSQVKELWSGVEDLTSLKKIDFSNSKNLREISSLCRARNVEHVYLEHCGSLSQVPSDFKHLAKLQTLILEGCSSLKVFPELSSNIECLVLSGTSIEQVPSSIRNMTQLHILCMRDCKRLVSLPTSICELKLLYSLSLSGCTKLEMFPEIPEPMWSLMSLELDKTSIEALSNITTRNIACVTRFAFEGRKLIPYNNCYRWIQVHNVCDCELLPYTHDSISYMFESSKCLSLVQLKYSLVNQRSELPFQFFYEKYCKKMEISSISRSALLTRLGEDVEAVHNKEISSISRSALKIVVDAIHNEEISSSSSSELSIRLFEDITAVHNKEILSISRSALKRFDEVDEAIHNEEISSSSSSELSTTLFEDSTAVNNKEISSISRSVLKRLFEVYEATLNEKSELSTRFLKLSICRRELIKRLSEDVEVVHNKDISSILRSALERLYEGDAKRFDDFGPISRSALKRLYEDIKAVHNEVIESSSSSKLSTRLFEDFTAVHNKMIASSSRSELLTEFDWIKSMSRFLTELDHSQKPHYKKFCFYNSFEFNRRLTIIDDIISSEYKFLDTEIRRRSKVKKYGFTGADVGVCYPNFTIPKWFRYQFENCSSGRITLNIGEILTDLSGFAVYVVVHFGDHNFEFNKLRVVCQAHYQLSDGRLLSWDFYSDYDTQHILRKLINLRSRDFMSAESRQMFDNCVDNLVVQGAVFDFYFLDENNKPIQGCSLRRCGINLLFEEESKKLGLVNDDEFKSSGSELLDSHATNTSSQEGVNIVVSISKHSLLYYQRSEFLFYGFLRLDGRDGMENPCVTVSRYDEKFKLPNFEGVLVLEAPESGAYRPGSNIPNFFEHKFGNSQMWIDIPPDWLDNSNFFGFVLCAVVDFKDFNCFNDCFKLQCQCDTSIAQYSSSSMHYDMRLKRELVDHHNFDSFRLRLEDKAHREIRRGLNGGEYISYVWSFKLRCLDENLNPLDQDKCLIRKCAVELLFEKDLRE